MSAVLGALTSDPNLLACELYRLDPQITLEATPPVAAGMGWYSPEDVLLKRFPAEQPPRSLRDLLDREPSDAVLLHSGPLARGASLDDHTQPFRFRRWLFASTGEVLRWSRARMSALAALPEYLQRGIRGGLAGEVLFALYLKELRELGRTDDVRLEAHVAARLLLKAAYVMDGLARDAGADRTSPVQLVATNGRMLIAARIGEGPLFYKLLEGASSCERCALDGRSPDRHSLAPAHRRVRSVAVSNAPVEPGGWLQLAEGEALAVDPRLNARKLGL